LGNFPRVDWRTYSPVVGLCWFIVAVLLLLSPVFYGCNFWLLGLGLVGIFVLLFLVKSNRYLSGFVLLGVGCCLYNIYLRSGSYDRVLLRDNCGCRIRGVVVSASYSGIDNNPKLRNMRPELVLREISLDGTGKHWQRVSGRVVIRLSSVENLHYGELVEVNGEMLLPEEQFFVGAYNYKNYLQSKGIGHIFVVSSIRHLGDVVGWRRFAGLLYGFRDRCVERLVRGMGDERAKQIVRSMTLGYRQGLSAEVRSAFLRSGAIHIFAISGLHVGIACSILLLLFRVARIRLWVCFFCLPFLLLFYVFLTGMSASAMRAWLMISVWSFAKCRYKAILPVNTVAFAALILLVINPGYIFQTGFLFSFSIVFVLVLGWKFINSWWMILQEKQYWVPIGARGGKFRLELWHRIWQVLSGSCLAWSGSVGLVAYCNGMLIVVSLLVNIVIALLAWVVLFLAFFKVFCSFVGLSFVDAGLVYGLEVCLRAIMGIVNIGSNSSGSFRIMQPAFFVVFLYYCSYLLALLPRISKGVRRVAISVTFVCLLVIVLPIFNSGLPDAVVFNGGQGGVPVVVLLAGQRDDAVIVNCGDSLLGRDVVQWLNFHGICQPKQLFVTNTAWGCSGGIKYFLHDMQLQSCLLPTSYSRTARLKDAYKWLDAESIRTYTLAKDGKSCSGGFSATVHKNGETQVVEYSCQRGGNKYKIVMEYNQCGTSTILIYKSGGKTINLCLERECKHSIYPLYLLPI